MRITMKCTGMKALSVEIASLKDAVKLQNEFISKYNLRGSELTFAKIYDGKKLIARVSYNGRVWDKKGVEVKI